jgi:hypothetical protein
MPIDPSIAMGFKNPQIQVQNPVAQYAQAQELNLNALKMQEAQQSMANRNMLRSLDPSSPDYINQVSRMDPKLGLELSKGRTQARTAEIEQKTKIGTLLKNYANQVVANPNLETAMLVVQRFGRDTGEDMSDEMARLQTIGNNPDALRQWGMGYAATADQILTPAIREFNYGQQNPAFTQAQLNKAAAGAARSTVILPPQEKAEQTERGKFLVEDYKTVTNAARVAARTLPAIEVNLDLIDQGFKTGFGTEVQKGAANILGALGVKNANEFATNAQVFQAKANEAVLQRQLEQKGPQTESDAQRITQTNAQLTNTPEANKFILDVAKAQLKRDIEQRNFYDSWFTKNKTYDGAEGAWYTGDGGKSLFSRPELKKYNIQAGASPQRQGSQQTTGGLSPAEQAELDSLRKQFNPAKK